MCRPLYEAAGREFAQNRSYLAREIGSNAVFFALGAGAICFFLSGMALLWLGFAAGVEHVEISLAAVPKHSISWWEVVSLVTSFGLSIFAAELVFRSSKHHL
jgi:hypothetical protein